MVGSDSKDEASQEAVVSHEATARPGLFVLALGSIGVVYGDIGTSPLYALREAVNAAVRKDGAISEPMILGVLSLSQVTV